MGNSFGNLLAPPKEFREGPRQNKAAVLRKLVSMSPWTGKQFLQSHQEERKQAEAALALSTAEERKNMGEGEKDTCQGESRRLRRMFGLPVGDVICYTSPKGTLKKKLEKEGRRSVCSRRLRMI